MSTTTNNPAPVVHKVTSSQEKAGLAKRLTDLSSTTEMKAYGVEQWQYLLDAGDVTPFVVPDADEKSLLGCVLRIGYSPHAAYGMMLVSTKARGQGLARKLLSAAMKENSQEVEMHILGTCTEMGRPLYEKIGYQKVSTVTRMTVKLSQMELPQSKGENNVEVAITDNSPLLPKLLELDAKATGLDRSPTLTAIHNYNYVQTATITDSKTGELVLAALLTQHTDSKLIMVGPILGGEQYVPSLFQNIQDKCKGDKDMEVALIVSDHAGLVSQLKKLGFQTAFELGAMTLNGVPMPGDRNLYLGLIHPTLG